MEGEAGAGKERRACAREGFTIVPMILVPRPRLNLVRFHGVLAPNAKLRPQIILGRPASVSDDLGRATHHSTSAHMSWAQLLKRVFDIDIDHCLHCGGTLKTIAAIEDLSVITRIFAHLGLPTRAPPHHLRYAILAPLAVRPAHPGAGLHAS